MKNEQAKSIDKISDKELDSVTGGRKAGEGQKEFLTVKSPQAGFAASSSF
ncbi:bacteriocin [Bradyrhizobium sp. AUGA SZCCT0182]|nr:bacteriocin [Bradyrhizobium sp. AUGA SZCCT0182]MBR1232019.1 bacteriocin [Bradyrhizobium sp. AUGA SZCCT0182]